MRVDLECIDCRVHYSIRWKMMDHSHGDPDHPLEDDDDSNEELFPEKCPFCGNSAEEIDS